MMKKLKKFTRRAAAIFILLAAPASPAFAREVIKVYDVDIQINKDSSMAVTENITASVENRQINKGIIRVFPVTYKDARGNSVSVGFEVLGARIDGRLAKVSVTSSGRYKEARIGDPDMRLSPGDHTFTVSYITTRQIGFFDGYDELYWNVTGNNWSFPILSVSCRVALPDREFGEDFKRVEWYSGAYGEKGKPGDAELLPGGVVKTRRALARGEGFTVVYAWEKGAVTPPPPPKTDDIAAQSVVGASALLLIILWLGYAWHKWGRDPAAKAVIPLFYPPEDVSPAYTRYIYKMKLDQTGFAAAVIGLAVKGAIKIEEKKDEVFGAFGGTITLIKEEGKGKGLQPEEETLLEQLFPGGERTLALKHSNCRRLLGGKHRLKNYLKKQGRVLYSRHTLKLIPAIGVYAVGTAALYPFSGQAPINLMMSVLSGLVLISIGMAMDKVSLTARGDFKQFISRIAPAAALGAAVAYVLRDSHFNPVPGLFFIASAGIISVMRPLMASYTEKGADLTGKVLGLRLYMNTAEKARLEMFNPPEETPRLFERLLPYALALGVADTWADRFEKILSASQYQPAWYDGPSPYIFMNGGGLSLFSSNLQSQMTSSMRSPVEAPGSSSGSFGGGFSGGGGGGGGGRGW